MKICHIAATTEGATWMFEQLRDLRDRFGHEVSAIVTTGDGGLLRKLEHEQIPYIQFDFSFPDFTHAYTLLTRVLKLSAIFRRERFDVVQTHLFDSMVMGRLAGWLADVPVRLAMIAGPYHLEAPTPSWIDGSTQWMETALIPSCNYTRDLYRNLGVKDDRMSVIYYGPDERKFDAATIEPADIRGEMGWDPDVPLVAMVAYFYPALPASSWTPPALHNRANKRHEDLIKAAPAILRRFPETRFLFIGSAWGETGQAVEAALRRKVADAGLEDRVLFLGFRKDVNNLLRAVDVSVQASISENLGGTLESLLMECPTVATRSGGMVDSIRDSETGVLVEPLDPDSLAEGVLRLLSDREQARRYGKAGRALALELFTLRRTVDDLADLYSRLSKRRASGYGRLIPALRKMAAIPIFGYLAVRLAWDLNQDALRRKFDIKRQAAGSMARSLPKLLLYDVPKALLYWIWVRPLYIYGWIRARLAGTERLRRWDAFFSHVRRRPATDVASPVAPEPGENAPKTPHFWFLDVPKVLLYVLIIGVFGLLYWVWVWPLYVYGWLRARSKGTIALRRWDALFAIIRGRDAAALPLDDASAPPQTGIQSSNGARRRLFSRIRERNPS